MALENTDIQNQLTEKFGESVSNFQQESDLFAFEMTADSNTAVLLS